MSDARPAIELDLQVACAAAELPTREAFEAWAAAALAGEDRDAAELTIRIVDAGLVYLDVPSTAKEIVIGAIIVLAVMLDVIRRGEIPWLRLRRKAAG